MEKIIELLAVADKITQKLERLVRMMAKLWAQEIMFAETIDVIGKF